MNPNKVFKEQTVIVDSEAKIDTVALVCSCGHETRLSKSWYAMVLNKTIGLQCSDCLAINQWEVLDES